MKDKNDLIKAYNEQFSVNFEEKIETAYCCDCDCCESICESAGSIIGLAIGCAGFLVGSAVIICICKSC